jgi:FKBP-type peptidyl-prolyl cis-trans isomerase FklB
MSYEEAQSVINDFFQTIQAKVGGEALSEGKAFLEENGNRSGIVTLESGLQYEVLSEGSGATPQASDTVKVHYHGTLISGKVFDSSVNRGEPATFGVTQVISGWVEALQLMPVGSKWKLYIPSELAYGAQGAGQAIAPHSALIFEVELLDIV